MLQPGIPVMIYP